MRTLHRASVHEHRLLDERAELGRVSTATLRYMWEASTALEAWLRMHGGNLLAIAQEEYDLYEAMRLSARLSSVSRNAARAERRSERIRAEVIRRELDRG